MSVTMTRDEREQFLAGVHVGVLSVASVDGGGPLAVPVWYVYQPGGPVNVFQMTPEHWLSVDYSKVYG